LPWSFDDFLVRATSNTVYYGGGDATFDPALSTPASGAPFRVLLADLDEDGDLDIVSVDLPSSVRVILNNGLMRGKSIVTTYNHLSNYARSVGDKVNRGDVIGYVGSTGYSTGCHLHFMVLVDGRTTDPMGWL
jgi:hypothetical protein